MSSIWAVAKTIPIDMHVVEDQRIRKKSPVDDKKKQPPRQQAMQPPLTQPHLYFRTNKSKMSVHTR